ncbi:MAG: hypothetical protein KI788_17550 [Mameliella sp.]|nr:hypothetical protein [Mameliella sp.]
MKDFRVLVDQRVQKDLPLVEEFEHPFGKLSQRAGHPGRKLLDDLEQDHRFFLSRVQLRIVRDHTHVIDEIDDLKRLGKGFACCLEQIALSDGQFFGDDFGDFFERLTEGIAKDVGQFRFCRVRHGGSDGVVGQVPGPDLGSRLDNDFKNAVAHDSPRKLKSNTPVMTAPGKSISIFWSPLRA